MVLELILGAALIGVGIRAHRRKHEKRYWREVARQEQVNNAALGAYATTMAARQAQAGAGTVVTQQRTVVQPVPVPVPVPVQSMTGQQQQMYPTMYPTTGAPTMGYTQQPTMVAMPAQQPMMMVQQQPQQMQMLSPRYAPQQQQQQQYMQMSSPMNQSMQTMQTRPPATSPTYMSTGAPPMYGQTQTVPMNVATPKTPMNVHPDFFVPDTQIVTEKGGYRQI